MLACPKCVTTELRTPSSSGTPVLRCYSCHGMWVTHDEVEALAAAGALSDPASMLPQKVQADAKAGLCPHGHGILARARVEVEDPFYLERCPSCSGLWFDGGEWERVASLHLQRNLADLWDPDLRRRLHGERLEEGHRARMSALLGERLVADMEAVVAAIEASPHRHEAAGYLAQRLDLASRPPSRRPSRADHSA